MSGFNNCGKLTSAKLAETTQHIHGTDPTLPTEIPKVGDFDKIASNFEVNDWLRPSGTPGYMIGDAVGAFRFLCNVSHILRDDPIVYPGQPGKSHLHTFFGNTLANAFSTYESLRKTGDGTCAGGPLNRSAYWIPTTLNGKGQAVLPDHLNVYYKGPPKKRMVLADPNKLPPYSLADYISVDTDMFGRKLTGSIAMPRGLRMIFGYNMGNPEPWTVHSHYHWKCNGPGAAAGVYGDLPSLIAAGCPLGTRIALTLVAPNCWDGVNLDSPDHRSHMSERIFVNGAPTCPVTHPIELPHFTLAAWFSHDGPADLATWYLSSDRMAGMAEKPNGSTAHTDWFGAWDDDIMDNWIESCVNDFRSCSGGGMGDGTGLKARDDFSFEQRPNLVPIPN